MTVKRKPSAKTTVEPTVEQFINQGLNTIEPAETTVDEGVEKAIKLRVDIGILADLDQHLKDMRPSPSRNHWIVKAIVEKLDRDSPQS